MLRVIPKSDKETGDAGYKTGRWGGLTRTYGRDSNLFRLMRPSAQLCR